MPIRETSYHKKQNFMKRLQLTISILLILQGLNYSGKACTTFCINDSTNLIFGRNLDFEVGFGHVVINKRNIKKTAMIQPPEKTIEWVSLFGSMTFNQNGRDLEELMKLGLLCCKDLK